MRKSKNSPPTGLWISPKGKMIPVIEHLLAIQKKPAAFGLPESVRDLELEELHAVGEKLIASGWTRFRWLMGVYAFEVDDARERLPLIEQILVAAKASEDENVAISQVSPKREYQGTVRDVFDRVIFRFSQNPKKNTWRFS
jgi:hypothetical protein